MKTNEREILQWRLLMLRFLLYYYYLTSYTVFSFANWTFEDIDVVADEAPGENQIKQKYI